MKISENINLSEIKELLKGISEKLENVEEYGSQVSGNSLSTNDFIRSLGNETMRNLEAVNLHLECLQDIIQEQFSC